MPRAGQHSLGIRSTPKDENTPYKREGEKTSRAIARRAAKSKYLLGLSTGLKTLKLEKERTLFRTGLRFVARLLICMPVYCKPHTYDYRVLRPTKQILKVRGPRDMITRNHLLLGAVPLLGPLKKMY